MGIAVTFIKVESAHIKSLRELFLHENNFQFVYNKCHDYGWSASWLCMADGVEIGYGSIWGSITREQRDAVFEFYIIKSFRHLSNTIFPSFCTVSNAVFIEAQSNDIFLSPLLYQYCENINAEAMLFHDHYESRLVNTELQLRKSVPEDNLGNDGDEYVLLLNNEIIGGGGLMLNYNKPYADIYMQIKEPFRLKGYGSWLVQELKKEAYRIQRVPSARCNINNHISRATLEKSGFKICGFILKGNIKSSIS